MEGYKLSRISLNTTYHVAFIYNNDTWDHYRNESATSIAAKQALWSYFTTTQDPLKNMNRNSILAMLVIMARWARLPRGGFNKRTSDAHDSVCIHNPYHAAHKSLPEMYVFIKSLSTKVTTHAKIRPIRNNNKKVSLGGNVCDRRPRDHRACTVAKTMNKKR